MSGQGRWGSLLSGAVAGLESRLDTILAEDGQASAKSRAGDAPAKADAADKRLQIDQGASRPQSRSRPNSRLQDRLAKAVNSRGESPRASTDTPSRPESPATKGTSVAGDAGRASIDSKQSEPAPAAVTEAKDEASKADDTGVEEKEVKVEPRGEETPSAEEDTAKTSAPVVAEQPAAISVPSMSIPSIVTPQSTSPRQSLDSAPSRPSIDTATSADLDIPTPRSPATVDVELSALRKTHEETVRDHREELNSHLERIDALQSKLTYLSQQLASSAKAASAEMGATPADKKLAEKDSQIAALMEEGQKLSRTEMKHLATIKKMRSKAQETDKEVMLMKQRLSKAEKSVSEQTDRARRAEAAEKATQEKLKIVGKIEKDIEMIKAEREEANLTITELRRQLSDALSKAEDAEMRVQAGALEAEKRVTASLKEDLDNLKIEKKLAEDRWKKDVQEAKVEATRQQERTKVTELELRGEIANLETKLELLRSRSEEVSSSATGDSQAKLLRQIETLQTQYALASENWQGIEGTLTSRVAALEKDRDETAKRESDIRRKARDVNSKARRLEDELENVNERARTLEQDLTEQRGSFSKMQARLAQAEAAAEEARADLEREKKVMESDMQQRLEEEKSKWRSESQASENFLRTNSPGTSIRKHSPDPLGIRRPMPRTASSDMPLTPLDRMLFDDRRPSGSPRARTSHSTRGPEFGGTPPLRQDSIPSSLSNLNGTNASQTPSITTFDHDEPPESTSSPHRTINDMISISTVGAGPSVQLVERMSAAVRRLESEKAITKEEMARLSAQRDEAREEVVALMREVEDKRVLDERVETLEKDLRAVEERYETTLEMLGEKSERVEELEGDVADLKKIYRDLVSTMK